MANILIAWDNRTDSATLSGGLWQSTLPLANLQSRALGKPARSNGLAVTSTQFTAAFSGTRPTVDVVALVRHNLSASAKWRITASNNAGTKVRTTGWLDIWPAADPAEMDWEDDRWWDGKPDAELIAQFPAVQVWAGGKTLWPSGEDVLNPARWTVEIDDSTNADGYVQISRVFIGRAFRPSYNCNWGAALGYESATGVETALLGTEFFDEREPARVFTFELDFLNDAEVYGATLPMQRKLDVHGEVIVVPDEDDARYSRQRIIYGRLRKPSPFSNPYYAIHSSAWEVKETIA